MAIQEIELENKEELEAPEALEEASEDEAEEDTLDALEAAMADIDESSSEEDNNGDTATEAEEVSLEAVRAELNELRDENKRLVSVVSRLVKNYGAKLGENSANTGIEAFRETSVEPKLPSDKLNLSGVPGLDEIVLG